MSCRGGRFLRGRSGGPVEGREHEGYRHGDIALLLLNCSRLPIDYEKAVSPALASII